MPTIAVVAFTVLVLGGMLWYQNRQPDPLRVSQNPDGTLTYHDDRNPLDRWEFTVRKDPATGKETLLTAANHMIGGAPPNRVGQMNVNWKYEIVESPAERKDLVSQDIPTSEEDIRRNPATAVSVRNITEWDVRGEVTERELSDKLKKVLDELEQSASSIRSRFVFD